MKLGQLLLHRRVIDRSQLHAALRRQARSKLPVGQILLDMGVVSRADVIEALRRQPHASVEPESLFAGYANIGDILDEGLAAEVRAAPVARAGDMLVVAMADPTDVAAIDRIRQACGLEVLAVAADPEALAACLSANERLAS